MPRHHKHSDSTSSCSDSLDKTESGCSGTDLSASSHSERSHDSCSGDCEGGNCGGCGGCNGGDCSYSRASYESASSFSVDTSCSENLDTSGSDDCDASSSSSSSSSGHKHRRGKVAAKDGHVAPSSMRRKLFVITWGPDPNSTRGHDCIFVNGKAHATIVLTAGVTYYFEVKQKADAYGKYKHAFMLTPAHVGNFNGLKPEPLNGSFEALYQGMASYKVTSTTPHIFHYQCPYHAYEGGFVMVR